MIIKAQLVDILKVTNYTTPMQASYFGFPIAYCYVYALNVTWRAVEICGLLSLHFVSFITFTPKGIAYFCIWSIANLKRFDLYCITIYIFKL